MLSVYADDAHMSEE